MKNDKGILIGGVGEGISAAFAEGSGKPEAVSLRVKGPNAPSKGVNPPGFDPFR